MNSIKTITYAVFLILVRQVYFWGYKIAKVYWFLFRPKTFGTKCIVQCGDELLLVHNSYGPKGWTFPGGGIKPGENPAAAAIREVKEEVGIVLSTVQSAGSFLHTDEYKCDMVYCFLAEIDKRAYVIDNTEVVEGRWFSQSSLPVLNLTGQETLRVYKQSFLQ